MMLLKNNPELMKVDTTVFCNKSDGDCPQPEVNLASHKKGKVMILKLVYFSPNGWYHAESFVQFEDHITQAVDFVRFHRDKGILPGLPLGHIWTGSIQVSVSDGDTFMPAKLIAPPPAGAIASCRHCNGDVHITDALFNQTDYFHPECFSDFYELDDCEK